MTGVTEITGVNAAPVFEERYRAFVQNSAEGIWRCETDEPVDTGLAEDAQIEAFYRSGYFAESNNAFARMYGFDSSAALTGARLVTLFGVDDPAHLAYLRAFIRSGYRLTDAELRETDASGDTRIFSSSLTGIVEDGKLVRAWGTRREITAQKRLEEALRTSEERFRVLFEQAAFPIVVVSLEGQTLMANRAAADFIGYSIDELQGMPVSEAVAPEDRGFLPEMLPHLLSQVAGSDHVTVRRAYKRRDGSECWGITTISVLRDAGGAPTSLLATSSDITAQTHAEKLREEALAALQESEERLRLALASGCMGTWDADLTTGRLTLSEDIPPLHGRPRQTTALSVTDWVGWLHPADRNRVSLAFASALRGESDYDVQFRTLWPDGETFRWIATRALITRDADGAPRRAVGYTRDITREKEQEAEREALRARQRQFMRDFVFSLTEGKFRLCHGENDLPQTLPSAAEPVALTVSTLRTLRLALNTVTKSLGFCPERAQDIETAVGEAIMNAATHGGGGEGHVCADPARGIVQIWIRDRGGGISEEALPKVLGKGVSLAGTLGHGFWLMLSTGDRVFLLSSPSGTTIVLEQERTVPKPVWL